MKMLCGLFFSAVFLSAPGILASADPAQTAQRLAAGYLNGAPVQAIESPLTLSRAMDIQRQFVQLIRAQYGPRVGYKAALTNSSAQARFEVSHPLRGVLMEKMLLKSGEGIPTGSGIRLLYEGDLMVRVGSDRINEAITHREVLAALDAVIPFIEVPDLVYARDVKLDGPALAAVNVGARFGVMGDSISVSPTDAWLERLAELEVELLDEQGNSLARGRGADLLEHPLNVVLWIRDSLLADDQRLRRGDLLSLGSLARLIPVVPGMRVRARYTGLDPRGTVDVIAEFN